MIRRIETFSSGRMHALADGQPPEREPGDANRVRVGRARCGRAVRGFVGACVPALIDCQGCRRALRRDGLAP